MRSHRALPALVITIAIAANGGTAWAYTLLDVIPVFQLNQLYDDNIQLTPTHHQADLVTDLVAGFYLDYRNADRDGAFQYDTVGEKFVQYSENDNFAQTHFIEFNDHEHLGNRTNLWLDDWFLTGKIPSSLFTSGSVAGTTPSLNSQLALAVLARIQSISNFGSISLDHKFNDRWTTSASIREEFFSTQTVTAIASNLSLSTDYMIWRHIGIGGGYEGYDFRFDDAPSPVDAHYPQARLRWIVNEQLTLAGNAGPIVFQQPDGMGTSIKLGYGGSLVYLTPLWRIKLSGGQEPGITSSGGAGLTRSASADIGYSWTHRLSLFAGMSYYQLNGGGQGTNEIISYGGGAAYRLSKLITVYCQYVGLLEPVNAVPGVLAANGEVRGNVWMFGAAFSFRVFRRAL
jgi:hypothetical protein